MASITIAFFGFSVERIYLFIFFIGFLAAIATTALGKEFLK